MAISLMTASGLPQGLHHFFIPTIVATQREQKKTEKIGLRAGNTFVGGTLKGLESKIGYLQRLGVTAIWISPVFKQIAIAETYHGYGIQNFLDVDPHFGSRDDLISVVQTAHRHDIRVILDIILNHSGDVFAYRPQESTDFGWIP